MLRTVSDETDGRGSDPEATPKVLPRRQKRTPPDCPASKRGKDVPPTEKPAESDQSSDQSGDQSEE